MHVTDIRGPSMCLGCCLSHRSVALSKFKYDRVSIFFKILYHVQTARNKKKGALLRVASTAHPVHTYIHAWYISISWKALTDGLHMHARTYVACIHCTGHLLALGKSKKACTSHIVYRLIVVTSLAS
jgi:hypothetical protein